MKKLPFRFLVGLPVGNPQDILLHCGVEPVNLTDEYGKIFKDSISGNEIILCMCQHKMVVNKVEYDLWSIESLDWECAAGLFSALIKTRLTSTEKNDIFGPYVFEEFKKINKELCDTRFVNDKFPIVGTNSDEKCASFAKYNPSDEDALALKKPTISDVFKPEYISEESLTDGK